MFSQTVQLGGLTASRFILGSNPFSGFSHQGPARDAEMMHYYTLDRLKASYPSRFTNEGDILLVAQTHRDQERNRQECLDKLVEMIRQCLQAPTPRKKTKPTWGSQLRRMDAKRRNSAKKEGRRGGGQD